MSPLAEPPSDAPQTDGAGLTPEDAARASLYGLLARLFRAGPDASLLASLVEARGAIAGDGALAQAWQQLSTASGRADPQDETVVFDTIYIGVGKAPVSTYLSNYVSGRRKDQLLVDLRSELATLGLARMSSSVEPEDNVASVLEVMHHLVTAGSDADSLARQRAFCAHYLLPGCGGFCAAAAAAPLSDYHRAAVELLEAFVDTEQAQFEMT